MDLIILVLGIALIALVVGAITDYIPMPPVFKSIIYIACAVVLILFIVRQLSGHVPNVLN